MKRIISLMLAVIMTILTISNNIYAAAENNDYTIQNISELEAAIKEANQDGNISEIEKQNILNNTSDELKVAYVLSLQDKIENIIENTEIPVTCNTNNVDDERIASNKYKINDAVDVELEICDEAENITRGTTVTQGGGPKDLGNKKTTGTYKFTLFGATIIQLKLTLGYTVYKTYMSTRYASTSKSISVGSITSSTKITDSKAAAVGHDMNCTGTYNINVAGYASMELELTLQVKWDHNIDSDTKYITYKLAVI